MSRARPWPCLAVALMAALAAGAAPAHAARLVLDPGKTEIRFSVGSTFHEVHGVVDLRSGAIRFDPVAGTAGGRIVVDATSATTSKSGPDKKMHHAVLETKRFPQIVFEAVSFTGRVPENGLAHVKLPGVIEIHGTRHDLILEADIIVTDGTLTGTARFEVPYVAWGMKDPSSFIFRAKKIVEVELDIAGRLDLDPAPPGP